MSVSNISAGSGLELMRQLLQLAGANKSSSGAEAEITAAPEVSGQSDAPAPPRPEGPPSDRFGGATLASLLETQTSASQAASIADALDTNGDGVVSADELAAALNGKASTDKIAAGLKALDTDGDGALGTGELTAALDQAKSTIKGHHRHHGHHGVKSLDDIASSLIGALDQDGDGSLSLNDVTTALKSDGIDEKYADQISRGFSRLDQNSDGQLTSADLQTAIEAFFKAAGFAHSPQQQATSSVSATA